MGRPKGSKNKPKVITPENAALSIPEVPVAKKGSAVPVVAAPGTEVPKRRGRPPGSTNKPKVANGEPGFVTAVPTAPAITGEVPKRRGRPPGSKNKATEGCVELPPVPATATVEPIKRQGRPPGSTNKPKVVETSPEPITPPVLPRSRAAVTVVPDGGEESNEERAQITSPPVYSLEDLQNPALAPLAEHVAEIAALASSSRKVFYEERALPGISYELRVLKTLIDYLEIDVKKYIEDNEIA